MEPVRNHRNPIVVDAARLHRARVRKERCQTLVEGSKLLSEAIEADVVIDTVFALSDDLDARSLAEANGLRLTLVDTRALGRLADAESPRGPISMVEIPESGLNVDRNVLVAWGVSDPGNVGTLVRTAAAFDWDFAYTPGSADPWSPKALRAGAGGQFQVAVVRVDGIEALEAWHTVATVVGGGVDPSEVTVPRVAVLIGEEAPGLPAEVVAGADIEVTIAMPGTTESLNAAAAAAIIVYELDKAKGQEGGQV